MKDILLFSRVWLSNIVKLKALNYSLTTGTVSLNPCLVIEYYVETILIYWIRLNKNIFIPDGQSIKSSAIGMLTFIWKLYFMYNNFIGPFSNVNTVPGILSPRMYWYLNHTLAFWFSFLKSLRLQTIDSILCSNKIKQLHLCSLYRYEQYIPRSTHLSAGLGTYST